MKIESLHIYPIKGCAGIDLTEMSVVEAGPEHDRQWMIVDADGKFVSQRTHPQMSLITPKILKGKLAIKIAGQTFDVSIPETDEPYESVEVWSTKVKAQVSDNKELQAALAEHMKKDVRLVKYGEKSNRITKKREVNYGVQTRFTDRAPFLIVNPGSLAELNSRLSTPIPISRFRPNIVLSESPAWGEDNWESGTFGDIKIEITQGCGRCNVINIDQKTGVAPNKEVLIELSKFRKKGTNVYFGMMGVHRNLGTLKVGNEVRV